MIQNRISQAAGIAALLAITFLPQQSRAIDGVIEISHDRALAGGITIGDAPGYPVTLNDRGSYRLHSDLSGSISVKAKFVSLDLAGFVIDGGGTLFTGISELTGMDDTKVSNGTVQNFILRCVNVGNRARIVDVRAENCGAVGIDLGDHSIVRRSSAQTVSGSGILTGNGSHVSSSRADSTSTGFDIGSRSFVSENTIRASVANGLELGAEAIARNNVLIGNGVGLSATSSNILHGNLADSSSLTGIVSGSDTVLTHNTMSENLSIGVSCTDRCVLIKNSVTNATRGVVVDDRTNIVGNTATNCNSIGFDCGFTGGGDCHFVGNTAIANSLFGIGVNTGGVAGSYKDNTLNSNGSDVSKTALDPGFNNSCSGTVPCP